MTCHNEVFGLIAGHVLEGSERGRVVVKHRATAQEAIARGIVVPGRNDQGFESEIGIIQFERPEHPFLKGREPRCDMYRLQRPRPREPYADVSQFSFDFGITRSFDVAREFCTTLVYKDGATTGLTVGEPVCI
jgi:hypothetical protein